MNQTHEIGFKSDSETILHQYEESGRATPNFLDGMLAFSVADGDRLILARDRIGIKPLYYGHRQNSDNTETLYFASELKALTLLVDEIREFPPGTIYDSASAFHTYYQVPHQA